MKNLTKPFFWYVFSENGTPSSKRVLGCLMLITILGVLISFSITEGCTDNVKDIIELVIITAGALLGISSVTSIWKGGNSAVKSDRNEDDEEEMGGEL